MFVTLGDQIMEIFILRRAHGAQAVVINDDQIDTYELLQLALVGVGGTGGV